METYQNTTESQQVKTKKRKKIQLHCLIFGPKASIWNKKKNFIEIKRNLLKDYTTKSDKDEIT